MARFTGCPSGEPHGRAWALVRQNGPDDCYWCRAPFTTQRPPTEDHVVPRSQRGTRADGGVLSCQSCNSARGDIPFDEYREACDIEHERAAQERREYRRPKRRLLAGEWIVTSLTRRQIRDLRAASA